APPRAGCLTSLASPIIALDSVAKTFESRAGATEALRAVSLAVDAGEFVSIIGPSGCGKSSLLRIVGDLVDPSAGTVRVNGKSARQARLDRDYGIVFQTPVLYEWRTVLENVRLPLELAGRPRGEREQRPRALLRLVGLEGVAGHYPWHVSGGMQQRVSIARARDPGVRVHPPAARPDPLPLVVGRAVRRARRDDPRAAQPGAVASLRRD